jgi:hypothetical protein
MSLWTMPCIGLSLLSSPPISILPRLGISIIRTLQPPNSKQHNMQLTTTLLAATAFLITTASAGQVNFYSDTNCQNYIGERHPASFQTTGCVTSSSSPPFPYPSFRFTSFLSTY